MKYFGLIGNPLTHSFSAEYFNAKFKKEGILARYDLLQIAGLDQLGDIIRANKLSGFNVTIPFKETIIPFLHNLSEEARTIAAVNCVKCLDGKLEGFNTDAFGFEVSLRKFLVQTPNQALVLGNGGSSRAVQFVLDKLNINYSVVSRKGVLNFENLHPALVHNTHLIVNTTPVGMYPHVENCLSLPFEAIGSRHYVVDLIYNPNETLFLKKCRLAQANTLNGLDMLHLQADKSWEIWNS